jgi:hypothetical protein
MNEGGQAKKGIYLRGATNKPRLGKVPERKVDGLRGRRQKERGGGQKI